MTEAVVGSVAVDVVPSAAGFGKKTAAQVEPKMKALGERIGRALADKIADSIRKGLGEGFVGSETAAKKAGDRSGKSFGGEFARTARTRIEAALRSLPDAQIGVATSRADQELKDLRARLAALSDKTVGVDIDEGQALAEIAEIQAALTVLGSESPSIQVKVDTGRAAAELGAFRLAVEALTGPVGGGGSGGGLAKMKSLAAGAGASMMSLVASMGPVSILAAVAMASVLVTLGVAAAGVTAALAVPIGVAAGGLTLFGVLAGFAVKNVLETSKQIDTLKKKADGLKAGAERDSVLADLKKLESSLTASQRGFLRAKEGLSKAFGVLTKGKAGDALLAPLTSGMNLLAKIMPKVEPLIVAVSDALSDLLDNLSKKAGGNGFSKFIDKMAELAGPSIKAVASIIGSIAESFGGLFKAASDTGMSAIDGMAKGLGKLAGYLNSDAGQAKMQEFFQWLQDNGPGILDAIGKIGKYIGMIIDLAMKIGPAIIVAIGWVAAIGTKLSTLAGLNIILENMGTTFSKIGEIFRGVYNATIGPVLSFMIGSIGALMKTWAAMLGVLGHVPGFGWAKDAAKAMGNAADDALNLAGKVRSIPDKVKISVTSNIPQLIAQAEAMNAALKGKKGAKTHYSTGWGGGQTAYASGTTYSKEGPALVGERGPELVYLRGGSKVIPADQTRKMLAPSASPQNFTARLVNPTVAVQKNGLIALVDDRVEIGVAQSNLTQEQAVFS